MIVDRSQTMFARQGRYVTKNFPNFVNVQTIELTFCFSEIMLQSHFLLLFTNDIFTWQSDALFTKVFSKLFKTSFTNNKHSFKDHTINTIKNRSLKSKPFNYLFTNKTEKAFSFLGCAISNLARFFEVFQCYCKNDYIPM